MKKKELNELLNAIVEFTPDYEMLSGKPLSHSTDIHRLIDAARISVLNKENIDYDEFLSMIRSKYDNFNDDLFKEIRNQLEQIRDILDYLHQKGELK